jgi:hypothetical protein
MIGLGRRVVVGSSVILAAWLLPSATSEQAPPAERPRATAAAPAQRAAAIQDALVLDVEAATARLRQYESSRPGSRRPGRNPFRFGQTQPRAGPVAVPPPPPPEADAPVAPVAQPATLRLIGIAERGRGDPTRIAILASPSDVHLAAAGDLVIGRYTVLAVLADAAEFRDETTGAVVRFALPPR